MLRTIAVVAVAVTACTSPSPAPDAPPAKGAASPSPAAGSPDEAATPTPAPPVEAQLGKAAPAFELTDTDGKAHRLADYAGKTVILEWFNPKCPFVNFAHTKGELKDMAASVAGPEVVWLGINSGGPGREGHGADATRDGIARFAMQHPVLLDPEGNVGHRYGAEKTPHMYLVGPDGTLVYKGAIDNAPFGEVNGGGELVNYLGVALADLAAGRPIETPDTPAYGCTVKYAKS